MNLNERRSEIGESVGDTDGVWPKDADIVVPHERHHFLLQAFAFLVGVGETLGDDDGGAYVIAHAGFENALHVLAGDGDDGEIDAVGRVIEVRINAIRGRRFHIRINDKDVAGITEIVKRRQNAYRTRHGTPR